MEKVSQKSEFTGGFWGLFGTSLVCALMSIFTLTIATPWAICKLLKWYTEHTYYNGKQLTFNGKGGNLFGKIIVWFLLTIVTVGIYGLLVPIKFMRWQVENTTYPVSEPNVVRVGATQTVGNPQPVGQPQPITQKPVAATTVAPAPARPVGTPQSSVANLSSVNDGVRTTAPYPQQRPASPLTQAPAPKAAPAPEVKKNNKAGLGAAIFAFIFAILAYVVFAFAFVLPSFPELTLPFDPTYLYYATIGLSAFALLLSFIGMGKFGSEKKRSGAKPVATLIISILAMLECLAIIFIALCFALPMLSAMKELIASYLSLFIVV